MPQSIPFSPTIAPTSGSKARPPQHQSSAEKLPQKPSPRDQPLRDYMNPLTDNGLSSTSSNSDALYQPHTSASSFPGLTGNMNGLLSTGKTSSSTHKAGPVGSGIKPNHINTNLGATTTFSHDVNDDDDMHSTPPGIMVPASPMAVSITTEKLESIAAQANIYDAISQLCAFLATNPARNSMNMMNIMNTQLHSGRVKVLLESKALEIIFQQIFGGDNRFLQQAHNWSVLNSLFAQLFHLEHVGGISGEVALAMSQQAISDIVKCLQTLNNQFITLKAHCKQTFTVGPTAVGRRIANTIRKVHTAMVAVFASGGTAGSAAGSTSQSSHLMNQNAKKLSDEGSLSWVESMESKLNGMDTELDNLFEAHHALQQRITKVGSRDDSDADPSSLSSPSVPEIAKLGDMLELRELEADRLGALLKYVNDAKTMQKLIEPAVVATAQSVKVSAGAHKSGAAGPSTPQIHINLNSNDELLTQGLLTDCGESAATLHSKTANTHVLHTHIESLNAERSRTLQPIQKQVDDMNTQLSSHLNHQQSLLQQLAQVNKQIEDCESKKQFVLQSLGTIDEQFKVKLAALEQASNLSLSCYELRDTVSAIIHEIHTFDSVLLDGAGVGSGQYTAKMHADMKAQQEVGIIT
jgi:uncharacterized membrane-anchored protein YhcB (DUF1043 family)